MFPFLPVLARFPLSKAVEKEGHYRAAGLVQNR